MMFPRLSKAAKSAFQGAGDGPDGVLHAGDGPDGVLHDVDGPDGVLRAGDSLMASHFTSLLKSQDFGATCFQC